jgi:hypothetical protein
MDAPAPEGFSPWASSGLLSSTRQRFVLAAVAAGLLWLATLWAGFGLVAPPSRLASTAATAALGMREPPAPASPLRVVAMAGTPAPGGGSYDRFGVEEQPVPPSVNARGDIAFFARLMRSSADEGLFLASNGHAALVAQTGGNAPGGGTISSFTDHPAPALNGSGEVAFAAGVDGGHATAALLAWKEGRLSALAESGAKAPGVAGGAFFDFSSPAINDAGDVAFLATVRRGHETVDAIYRRGKDGLTKVVAAGDPAPGGGAFSGLGAPAINNKGVVAFAAVVEQGQTPGGIYATGPAGLRRLVGAGDAAPGGGMYTRLSEHVGLDDSGRVAFLTMLGETASRSAIVVAGEGGASRVAALGTPAPGGGSFASFGEAPSLAADGRIAFIAAVQGGPGTTGAWLTGPNGVERVASTGDTLADGRRISYFPIAPSVGAGPGGRVAFPAGVQAGEAPSDAIVAYAP